MPGGVAARTMAWRRRYANLPGPVRSSGEPSNGQPVTVEMYLAGAWVDVTSYVLTRDGGQKIEIDGGRSSSGTTVDPGSCRLQLNNRDGRFSPRNPIGPYYDTLGRNTPIRVSVPSSTSGKDYRFWGETSDLPQEWDTTGTDIWCDVTAAGVLDRLGRGRPPTTSVLRRGMLALSPAPIAYWPLEDIVGSRTMASAVTGVPAMSITGLPTLAAYDGFGSSDPLPTLTGASFSGKLPDYGETGTVTAFQVRMVLFTPAGGFTDGQVICRIAHDSAALGFWDIVYGTGGTLTLRPLDGDEATLAGSVTLSVDVRGRLLRISAEAQQNGTGVDCALRILGVNDTQEQAATGTLNVSTLTRVKTLTPGSASLSNARGLTGGTVGHIALWNSISALTDLGERLDPSGETAGARFQRVCSEARIPFENLGITLTDSAAMGPEPRTKALDRLLECEATDLGIMYESRGGLGLGYRPLSNLYNQAPALTLSYTGAHLSAVPKPVDDLGFVKNVVDVTNSATSTSARAEVTEGAMSTADPPEGIGEYGDPATVNVALDSSLPDQAGWRLHVGMVDEARYPQIAVNLARGPFTADPALRAAVLAVRPGDRVVLQGPLPVPPTDDISLMAVGYSETIDHFQHTVAFNCQPESPYRVSVAEDTVYGRADIDSVLYSDATSTATSIDVAPADGETILWTTDDPEPPWDIRVGGEVMTVTYATSKGYDPFTRVQASTWGVADSGQTWQEPFGAASDRSVTGTQGVMTLAASPETVRVQLLVDNLRDCEVLVMIGVGQVSTGQPLVPGIVLRYGSTSAFYRCRLHFRTDSAVYVTVVNSVTEIGAQVNTGLTYVANQMFWLRARIDGHRIRGRVWADGATEPMDTYWHIDRTITSNTVSSGSVGLSASAITGLTNVAPTCLYDEFDILTPQTLGVTRSINGTVKAHTAGAPVVLANPSIAAL